LKSLLPIWRGIVGKEQKEATALLRMYRRQNRQISRRNFMHHSAADINAVLAHYKNNMNMNIN
jgi:hypothetical protein